MACLVDTHISLCDNGARRSVGPWRTIAMPDILMEFGQTTMSHDTTIALSVCVCAILAVYVMSVITVVVKSYPDY